VSRSAGKATVGPVVATALSALRMWPQNPRTIRPARLDDLKRAMSLERAMLEAKPLLALPDRTVFAGNRRLRAARELGWESIPVVTVSGLSPERVKSSALLDNNSFGEWDEPALAEFLVDPRLAHPVEGRRGDSRAPGHAGVDGRRGLPARPARLLCGNSTDLAALERVIAGERVAALVTDFPWASTTSARRRTR
jgi:ParB-like nuclease family protein